MDILINWGLYETQFRGERISMELFPLQNDAYAAIAPLLKPYVEATKGDDKIDIAIRTAELTKKALPIFRDYVQNIQGLTVNGKPVTPEDLATNLKLSNLALSVISELVMRSVLWEDERKNLKLPSDISLTDEATTP